MPRGGRALVVGAALLIAALDVRALSVSGEPHAPRYDSDRTPGAAAPVVPPPGPESDHIGSRACAPCHQRAFEQWERSLHIRMTKAVAEAAILGDFRDGTRLRDHGRSYEFGATAGRPFVRIAFGDRAFETYPVDYTLGFKRYQGYLSALPDGRIYVLPVFWHVETGRWLDWKEIAPVPDGAHDIRQVWNTNCFNCHATNLAQGFDTATGRYETTWTEMGIGCEACHGPGRTHVDLMTTWVRDPASRPGYDNSARNRALSATLRIFAPRAAAPRQTYDMCAYCHGNKHNVFLGFRAGDRYEDYALPFLVSTPIPPDDPQGEFWPDGRPSRFNRPQALTLSGCFKAGQVSCANCHVAHGSPNPFSLKVDVTDGRNGDLLCTQCHTRPASAARGAPGSAAPSEAGAAGRAVGARDAALEQHTFHPADSPGSRCIGCHMSEVNWRLLMRRRDHTFQPPVPEMTAAFGVPNACTTCHDDRPPEWAARRMDAWWGDGARRRAVVAVADTLYRAASGDPAALPGLARLAVDRSQGLLVRASAVEFIQQFALGAAGESTNRQTQTSYGAPSVGPRRPRPPAPVALTREQVNALVGAASDPEPAVRAAAVKAMLATRERQRVLTAITARLVDPARVVRAYAAEALLGLGIAELEGPAGDALGRAQDELALSLAAFPDVAGNHAALGWLQGERNRLDAAEAALDTAIRLDPRAARPWITRGVLAARQGRLDEAQGHWRRALELEPDDPVIHRLIAEALKRKASGR